MPTERFTLTRPDDWHLHLRDGSAMADIVRHSAQRFARALAMPNLAPPIATVEQALAYRQRILEALPAGAAFEPYVALYLTPQTTAQEVLRVAQSSHVLGIKLYPAGATTNSSAGVSDLSAVHPVFAAMEEHQVVLQIHGESTDPACDPFDREAEFIDKTLLPLVKRFPRLRIVFEHVTTRQAVDFVAAQEVGRVAATITPQHLLYDRRALFAGGIRPHFFCLPVLKRHEHREALLTAATSGDPRFFLGTDSAPHAKERKEAACGCAGIYSAHAAIELYAEAFDQVDKLERLEGFASHFGADFYRLPRNRQTIALQRQAWQVPSDFAFGQSRLVPLRAGETVAFTLVVDVADVADVADVTT